MGGKDAKLRRCRSSRERRVIRVTAVCMMGGVDVKSKRPAAEMQASAAAQARRARRELTARKNARRPSAAGPASRRRPTRRGQRSGRRSRGADEVKETLRATIEELDEARVARRGALVPPVGLVRAARTATRIVGHHRRRRRGGAPPPQAQRPARGHRHDHVHRHRRLDRDDRAARRRRGVGAGEGAQRVGARAGGGVRRLRSQVPRRRVHAGVHVGGQGRAVRDRASRKR